MIAEVIAANSEPMVPGNWIIAVIGALSTAAALIIGKLQGRKEAESREVTLKKPVPTVQTREEPRWATLPELEDLERRMMDLIREIKTRLEADRAAAREAHGNTHKRIDDIVQVLAELKGFTTQIDENVDKLLNLALHKK